METNTLVPCAPLSLCPCELGSKGWVIQGQKRQDPISNYTTFCPQTYSGNSELNHTLSTTYNIYHPQHPAVNPFTKWITALPYFFSVELDLIYWTFLNQDTPPAWNPLKEWSITNFMKGGHKKAQLCSIGHKESAARKKPLARSSLLAMPSPARHNH